MRTPTEYVMLRYLLGNPNASVTEICQATNLEYKATHRAYQRNKQLSNNPEEIYQKLRQIKETPKQTTYYFHLPNPDHWHKTYPQYYWISSELAAELEGYDLVAGRHHVYIDANDLTEAINKVKSNFGKLCSNRQQANLIITVADEWLIHSSSKNRPGTIINRGQLLIDYKHCNHIQLARQLKF